MPLDRNDPIVRNVIRLYKDAMLLREHHRYQSAYALSLIAAEEIAKVIIELWGELGLAAIKRLKTWHLTKQLVFASLSHASAVRPVMDNVINDGGTVTPEWMQEINHAWEKSHHFAQFVNAYNEAWENAKHRALYADSHEAGEPVPEVSETESRYLLNSIRESIMSMTEPRTLACAHAIYEYSVEQRKKGA